VKRKAVQKLVASAVRRVKKPAKPVAKTIIAPPKPRLVFSRITDNVLAKARLKTTKKLDGKPQINIFAPYQPAPGVLPKGTPLMAMDDTTTQVIQWANSGVSAYWSEGLQFLGYPYLSELSQRPEYRVPTQVIATEMTRKWITFQAATGEDDAEDKTDKIKQLTDEFDRLNVRDIFYKVAEIDGYMGRAHLYPDIDDAWKNSNELMLPIGDGRDEMSKGKVTKGSLKRLVIVEPLWCYPSDYNSNDPLNPDWYNPSKWFVMGRRIHASRLLLFVGQPVPDLLKPAYAFGGLSRSQSMKPYVDNWLQTRQSVNDIIRAFSVMVLKTDLSSVLNASDADGEGSGLFKRVDLFNAFRDNRGLFVLDNEHEDFSNVSVPLGDLDKLQAQSQEHMAAVSRIPLVKLLGISPAGLNASSEGELKAFYDTIKANQESFFRPNLTRIMHFAMLNIWGEVDLGITIKFEDLWALDELQAATLRKTEAETDDILVNGVNALHPEEVRKRVAADPESPYGSIDVEDVPEEPEEPDPMAALNLKGTMPFGKGKQGEEPTQE